MKSTLPKIIEDLPKQRVIACSGGVDSMLLATLAHRISPKFTRILHAASYAVPKQATQRVQEWGAKEGWNVEIIDAGELSDPLYVSNPVNRCYYCKSKLYESIHSLLINIGDYEGVVLSGANTDDIGDYRPGLIAAQEYSVRHPYVEANIGKEDIRKIARDLNLPFSELPASPCLSSRIYTGTSVTPFRLQAIEFAESLLNEFTKLEVVRCRIREDEMLVEVSESDYALFSENIINDFGLKIKGKFSWLKSIRLNPQPYRMGRAFVGEK
jgi:pyridinium-3,5-biscarboxylic acid mononucleotide sulfurtransferase